MSLITRQRYYDPHLSKRLAAVAPAFGCDCCGAWTVAAADGAVWWPEYERGASEELCQSCAVAPPEELRRRMRLRAVYLWSVADWLEHHAAGEICTDPALYVLTEAEA